MKPRTYTLRFLSGRSLLRGGMASLSPWPIKANLSVGPDTLWHRWHLRIRGRNLCSYMGGEVCRILTTIQGLSRLGICRYERVLVNVPIYLVTSSLPRNKTIPAASFGAREPYYVHFHSISSFQTARSRLALESSRMYFRFSMGSCIPMPISYIIS
ncbi:hypothetical protein NEOLEDRAFT_807585 [Neolentinus lepideus HHB14362 ss-1]|uniref:Uncharacterized protein n=1 Tax=Neolentinus lepideus HHB14362 ss-1 TaxID=1314782 RepID=A0A165PGI1_9AGAM|nr:hypothetical protein NEOLEDRAFT_807585 [Neolentinus lepideus HHB14362 ss-1]